MIKKKQCVTTELSGLYLFGVFSLFYGPSL